jgi:hypothetical protein
MKTAETRLADNVKPIAYKTLKGVPACFDTKLLAPKVSACGQVSKWWRLWEGLTVIWVSVGRKYAEE